MLDHWRLAWQIRSGPPTSRYPALQAYVTLLLKVDRPFCREITEWNDINLHVKLAF